MKILHIVLAILAVGSSFLASAYDPNPLHDFCVARPKPPGLFVNREFCKDPMEVQAQDFLFTGLNVAGNTSNQLGLNVTGIAVNNIRGLKTIGISIAHIDFAPYGLNPPHTHRRASEVISRRENKACLQLYGLNFVCV